MPRVQSQAVVLDNNQNPVNIDSLAQAMTYNGDNTLATVTAGPDVNGTFYKQTLTYSGGNLTYVSAWVRQ